MHSESAGQGYRNQAAMRGPPFAWPVSLRRVSNREPLAIGHHSLAPHHKTSIGNSPSLYTPDSELMSRGMTNCSEFQPQFSYFVLGLVLQSLQPPKIR